MSQPVPRPSFVIGITGNMDPDFCVSDANNKIIDTWSEKNLRYRLETILLFIRYGAIDKDGKATRDPRDLGKPYATLADSMRALLPPDVEPCQNYGVGRCFGKCRCKKRQIEFIDLEKWPGIGEHTELVLLSSLAPGADTIAVEVLEKLANDPLYSGRYDNGFVPFRARYKAPLPFPEELYLKASTFKNDDQRSKFRELCNALDTTDQFTVREQRDFETSGEPDYESDLKTSGLRHQRYQAAGEYVATFSDLLIAIYDDRFHSGSSAGSNEIVEAKRYGTQPGLLPISEAINWSDNGPVFHLFQPRQKTLTTKVESIAADDLRANSPLRFLHTYDLGPKDDLTRDRLRDIWRINQVADAIGEQRTTEARIEAAAKAKADAEAAAKAKAEGKDHNKASRKNRTTPPPTPEALGEQARRRTIAQYRDWQARGNQMIARIAANLGGFNDNPAKPNEDNALHALCGVPLKEQYQDEDGKKKKRNRTQSEIENELTEKISNSADIRSHLLLVEPLARLRRRTADVSNALNDGAKDLLRRLIVLSFTAVVALHQFNHWHIEADSVHAAGTATYDDHTFHWPSLFFATIVVIVVSIGLHKFRKFSNSGREETRHDARALAEGLRVQFYWGLAGLRRTVAANYMQRVRSEMDWVRNAISSVTLPSERFQDSFFSLPPKDQLSLLRMTVTAWVRPPMLTPADLGNGSYDPNCQQDYFWNSKRKQTKQLHYFHQGGSVLALAGLLHILPLAWFAFSKSDMLIMRDQPMFALFTIVIGGFILLVATVLGDRHHESIHKADHHDTRFRPLRYKDAHAWLHDLFHHRPPSRALMGKSERFWQSMRNFLFTLIPAIGILLISMGFSLLASKFHASLFPNPKDLGGILMGMCLIGGALMVAYGERQLLSEHARQYAAAHEFFNSARRRLEQQLERMEEAVQRLDHPEEFLEVNNQTSETEQLTTIRGQAESDFDAARERLHSLLFALGKEALDENSEWLVLHRARPMEPVMAG